MSSPTGANQPDLPGYQLARRIPSYNNFCFKHGKQSVVHLNLYINRQPTRLEAATWNNFEQLVSTRELSGWSITRLCDGVVKGSKIRATASPFGLVYDIQFCPATSPFLIFIRVLRDAFLETRTIASCGTFLGLVLDLLLPQSSNSSLPSPFSPSPTQNLLLPAHLHVSFLSPLIHLIQTGVPIHCWPGSNRALYSHFPALILPWRRWHSPRGPVSSTYCWKAPTMGASECSTREQPLSLFPQTTEIRARIGETGNELVLVEDLGQRPGSRGQLVQPPPHTLAHLPHSSLQPSSLQSGVPEGVLL